MRPRGAATAPARPRSCARKWPAAPAARRRLGALLLGACLLLAALAPAGTRSGAWSLPRAPAQDCQHEKVTSRQAGGQGRRNVGLSILSLLAPSLVASDGASAAQVSAAIPPPLKIAGSEKLMPSVGYGTCCRRFAKGPILVEGAKVFLANGGRLIDTAQLYENHRDVGKAIKLSGVPREELWITSKVNPVDVGPKNVVASVDQSLEELGVSYIDLMLLHGAEGWGVPPQLDVALWQGLVEAQKSGKVRSIGVSNHNQGEIQRLIAETGVKPAVNQLEYHPWVPRETRSLVKWCQDSGIAVTAYGSLGGALNKGKGDSVTEIAKRIGVSNSQVLLKWSLDQGVAVIPGATTEAHIKQNLQLTSFDLTAKDKEQLEAGERPQDFRAWHSCKGGCAS